MNDKRVRCWSKTRLFIFCLNKFPIKRVMMISFSFIQNVYLCNLFNFIIRYSYYDSTKLWVQLSEKYVTFFHVVVHQMLEIPSMYEWRWSDFFENVWHTMITSLYVIYVDSKESEHVCLGNKLFASLLSCAE